MPTIKPVRQINPHEVVNAFACDTIPSNKGTFVHITSGWENNEDDINLMFSNLGNTYLNTVSPRYGVQPRVAAATSGQTVFGMLLYDVRESDENGELLKFNPRKATEMQVALSGQAVPILRRGIVLYSGVAGTPTGGAAAYLSDSATDGSLAVSVSTGTNATTARVGTFLGTKDADSYVFIHVDCA